MSCYETVVHAAARDSANATAVGERAKTSHLFCTWQRGGSRRGKRGSKSKREQCTDSTRLPNLGGPVAPPRRLRLDHSIFRSPERPRGQEDSSAPGVLLRSLRPRGAVAQALEHGRDSAASLASNPEGHRFQDCRTVKDSLGQNVTAPLPCLEVGTDRARRGPGTLAGGRPSCL